MSGVTIGYELKLDTKRDNTFNGTYDDISAYMINDIELTSGFTRGQSAYTAISEPVAPPAQMSIYLDNRTGVFNQETLGSEVITNGTFATWSGDNPSSWTVTGESGSDPEISQVGTGEGHDDTGTGACNFYSTSSTVSISQTALTVNNTYRLQVTVGYIGVGSLAVYNGATRIMILSKTGTYTKHFVASSTSLKIESLSPAVNVTIDDVSVKQTARYTGLLVPGALLRFRVTYGTTQQLFIGKITYGGIRYGSNSTSPDISGRMVSILVQDAMNELGDKEYLPELRTNVRTDEVLTDLFNTIVPWPYAGYGTWMIGVPGYSEIAATAYIGGGVTNVSFEAGASTFVFAGSAADAGRGVQAQQFIRDVMMAEAGGRFYFSGRHGQWIFQSRNHDDLVSTSVTTIASSTFESMDYLYADDLLNSLTMNYSVKYILGAGSILWAIPNNNVRVEGKTTKVITGRYMATYPEAARWGGYDFLPIATDAYFATSDSDGAVLVNGGYDVDAEGGATSVKVTIDNSNDFPIYVWGLVFRGTPIALYDESATYKNYPSIAKYDERTRQPLNIKMIDDAFFASNLIRYLVNRYSEPIARIDSATFLANQSATKAAHLINRFIGDRITLTDSNLNHNQDYFIVGEQHRINAMTKDHLVTWFFKPASRDSVWLIGVAGKSEIGLTTRIGL